MGAEKLGFVGSDGGGGGGGADPGLVLLEAQEVASPVASVDFTTGIDATYDEYILSLLDVIPDTDGVGLDLRTSTDAGATWDAGASDYAYQQLQSAAGGAGQSSSVGASVIPLTDPAHLVGSAANETGYSGAIRLVRPSVADYTRLWGVCGYTTDTGVEAIGTIAGRRLSAADVTGVRFLFSSGNIESGLLKLYGVIAA